MEEFREQKESLMAKYSQLEDKLRETEEKAQEMEKEYEKTNLINKDRYNLFFLMLHPLNLIYLRTVREISRFKMTLLLHEQYFYLIYDYDLKEVRTQVP